MCCGEYEMETLGLRPMTLLDFPGKVACSVFLAGCNFRCPYCHNPSLVYHMEDSSAYTIEEFFSFLERRKNILDGVCISGGEPMIHHNLDQFITRIREMGFQVKLDTNGSFPNRLESLLSRHLLDYVAMDVKNDRNGYGRTVGLPSYTLESIQQSIDLLKKTPIPYEFRTTLVREFHGETNLVKLGEWLEGAPLLYLQNFVVSETLVGTEELTPFSAEGLQHAAHLLGNYVERVAIRGTDISESEL